MKLRNIFICLIAVVVSFLGISVDAASTAPNSYNTNFSNTGIRFIPNKLRKLTKEEVMEKNI